MGRAQSQGRDASSRYFISTLQAYGLCRRADGQLKGWWLVVNGFQFPGLLQLFSPLALPSPLNFVVFRPDDSIMAVNCTSTHP